MSRLAAESVEGPLSIEAWCKLSSTKRFDAGAAQPYRWLVEGTLLAGKPFVFGGDGGLGKSNLLLQLALELAKPPDRQATWLGRPIPADARGASVYISVEDDAEEIHRRLDVLDPHGVLRGDDVRVITIPDLGDAHDPTPIAEPDEYGRPQITSRWRRFEEVLDELALRGRTGESRPLRLIAVDPLANAVTVDINANPTGAAMLLKHTAALATRTGATVIYAHHTRKDEPPRSPAAALASLRGTAALHQNVRGVLMLWLPPTSMITPGGADFRRVLRAAGFDLAPGLRNIVFAAVVKANFRENPKTAVLARRLDGTLADVTSTYLSRDRDGAGLSWTASRSEEFRDSIRACFDEDPWAQEPADEPAQRRVAKRGELRR